ncbi:MAG: glycerophosphodiester phosphodiesterase [Anaerolineales bacterium]|nr:glycerophosphodiester phosphodiesterase [Anaerolineales bacterium]
MNHPYFKRNRKILVMAHRGEQSEAPENTMPAFQAAVDLGVDVIETDIHGTADGQILAYHDDSVERTTDRQGYLREMTLKEVQELDAGYQWSPDGVDNHPYRGLGLTIPTLQELFEAFPKMRFNIDIKQREPSIVKPFADLIRKHNMADTVLVGSFYPDVLAAFRREIPEVVTAASERETRRFYILSKLYLEQLDRPRGRAFQVPEYSGSINVVTKRFVEAAHRKRMEVHVWTVNELDEMERLIALGVDGIFTDYASRLIQLLDGNG